MAPNLEITTELRLGLPGDFQAESRQEKKRLFWEIVDKVSKTEAPAKNQVVGWPPVCSYRKRVIVSNEKEGCAVDDSSKSFVKVSMDGAIYLRKIELGAQGGYGELAMAIEKLFSCAGIGLTEENNSSEYMLIYEDKDGDWMLVGDVPWKMFLGSCKRLRVTKRCDDDVKATDLSPSPASRETLLEERNRSMSFGLVHSFMSSSRI